MRLAQARYLQQRFTAAGQHAEKIAFLGAGIAHKF
jgi:hypothetical protein